MITFTNWVLHNVKYNPDYDKEDAVYKFSCVMDRDMTWPTELDTYEALLEYLEHSMKSAISVWYNVAGLAFVSRIAWDDYIKAVKKLNGEAADAAAAS